jgi:hypothetical protein
MPDMLDIIHVSQTNDPTPYHSGIMQIDSSKTNHFTKGHKLFGRCIRHKDRTLCAMGAEGFYLLARFTYGGEKLDFTENKDWFDVKLLTDSCGIDNTIAVKDQNYSKAMFQSAEFQTFKEAIWNHVQAAHNPTNASIDSVLPGMNQRRLSNMDASIMATREAVVQGFEGVQAKFTHLSSTAITQEMLATWYCAAGWSRYS